MSILVATDFSDASRTALEVAARLARDRQMPLTVAHFIEDANSPPWGRQYEVPDDVASAFRREARAKLQEFVDETLPERSRPSTVEFALDLGGPADGIPERVGEDVDLVVLGATGRNPVAEFLLGSTAEDVVRTIDRPVLVVPSGAQTDSYDRIVAPVDFSECSRRSLELAASVARNEGAALRIVHSHIPPTSDASSISPTVTPERIDDIESQRESEFEEFVDTFDLGDLPVQTELTVGTPHSAIVDAVDEHGADLIVMGTHGRRGFERFFLGSTAVKILRRMPCSVMTVRTNDGN